MEPGRVKPSEYFRDIVEPTVADFEREPSSVRHAYLACIVTYHFADAVLAYTKRKGELGKIRKELAAIAPAFWTVEGIANMAKHVELTNDKLREKPRIEDTHVGPQAAFKGGVYWNGGIGWKGSQQVVRTKGEDGRFIDVRYCVREAQRAVETYLQRPDMQ
jgi:hypothetical protein